ncbi:MAG: hypothetical protein GF393_02050, partial [Armatimonadia bacterium]|nr:hypothetical protein [Armatimonadia bacterium]
LGRMAPGINTVDLSGFDFIGRLEEAPLDLAVIGPRGKTPSGAVDVDWVRLVKRPVGGLTIELEETGGGNGRAEIGETLVLTYTPDEPLDGPLAVTLVHAPDDTPVVLGVEERITLTGDDVLTGRVTISPEAPDFSARSETVIATCEVDGVRRNATALFGFSILPAPWRAQQAAEAISVGEAVFSEDFATSNAHTWRAYSEGWEVVRPEDDGPVGLQNRAYNGPREDGHWIALPTAPMADASLTAGMRPQGGAGPIMMALRFENPQNHYRLSIRSDDVAIERVRAGWVEVLEETTLPESIRRPADESATQVTFTVAGPTLLAEVDGAPVLHAHDTTLTEGRAALGLNRLNGQFDSVTLNEASATEAPASLRVRCGLAERDRAFGRDAGRVGLPVHVDNAGGQAVTGLSVSATLIRRTIYEDPVGEVDVPQIAAGESARVTIPLDATGYRSGRYTLVLRLHSDGEAVATDAAEIVIGPPLHEDQMDILWWGSTNTPETLRDVADAGINVIHEAAQRTPELLALGYDLGLSYYSYPPSLRGKAPAELQESFENPRASSRALRLDETDPQVREWALDTARKYARRWRSHPRLRYMLLNTEYEGHSYPSLSAEAEARYREALGFARPEEAVAPYMSPSTSLELFPDRIIPDDSEYYRWYRYFYAEGGGALNGLTSAQAQAMEEVAPGITPFHDPVLRAPQFHGRWDGMAMLNHWTYVERNPLDVAAFADELVCLAEEGGWEQQISQMIQFFAYADSAMPGVDENAPPYLRDARFIALPPDILTEAVWLVMSRPVDVLAFHGLQAAIETHEKEGYRYTNPHTLDALGRVTETLVEPYGPALKRIKQRRGPRVALLLSGANTVFGRIMEGGGTRSLHNPLTAARFGVDVVYDGDIKDGALDDYSVLAIPQCRFMLQSVRERIAAFQQAGGTVVLDSDARIEIPDAIVLPEISGEAVEKTLELVPGEVIEVGDSPRARLDADLRRAAQNLRGQLLPHLDRAPFVDSPHPYVVLDARASGDLSYIFAINDRREAGPYLGQFGAVLERGVPIEAEIHLREMPGALYDAIARRRLEVAEHDGGGSASVQLDAGWGKLLVSAAEPLAAPEVAVGDRPATGGPVSVRVQAQYASGAPVSGVVPLRFEVQSADGVLSDYSRFTATEADGSWATSVPVAVNEPAGTWVVRVTELIGGHTTVAGFDVEAAPTGERVVDAAPGLETVALWRFDGDEPLADALGGRYEAEPRGRARIVDGGKSGGCLESFASVDDGAEGLRIERAAALSPPGAFSAELWFKPKPEMADSKLTMLLDCNYYLRTLETAKANTGFAFYLNREQDGLRPRVILGFGGETVNYAGQPVSLEPGTWYRLGFAHDGGGGVRIYLDGQDVGGGSAAAGSIAPSAHPLIIGGRVGSSHPGCAGFIDEVRLAADRP